MAGRLRMAYTRVAPGQLIPGGFPGTTCPDTPTKDGTMFFASGVGFEFRRDVSAKVTGLLVSQGRARNIRFDRMAGVSPAGR